MSLSGFESHVIVAIFKELKQAKEKHPNWPDDIIHAAAIVAEESGELTKAALQWTYEQGDIQDAEKEAIQVIVTAIRFLEGLAESKYIHQPAF